MLRTAVIQTECIECRNRPSQIVLMVAYPCQRCDKMMGRSKINTVPRYCSHCCRELNLCETCCEPMDRSPTGRRFDVQAL
jgi:hypothetical protein